jgi:hypothetical protein
VVVNGKKTHGSGCRLFLSHLCGGEQLICARPLPTYFLSHLCGGEPFKKPATRAMCFFAVHHHIGGLEIVDNVLVVVLSVHHHIGGLEI